MSTQTVIYLLPCAAMPRGCASALAIDGPPGIELLALDLEVPEDKRVHGLITAAGWRLDHGKWVCPNHPFTTPAGPVTVTYWPATPTPQEAEAAKQAVIETARGLIAEMHARFACPGWQYTTTEGPRKQWSDADTPPDGEGWERNTDAGRDGWERFDYSERSYWRRPIPERERLVHENPELAEQVREGIAQAERGETVDLGSFAQHLDESDDD